jgi:gliding motility-associated-like protein
MKTILLLCFGIFVVTASFSQTTFQKKLDVLLDTPRIRALPDSKGAYVADLVVKNSIARLHVYKVDDQGNIEWHQEYVDNDLHLKLMSMEAAADGVILLLNTSTSEQQSNGYLIKLNTDGSLAWSRQIGTANFTQLYDIRLDEKGSIWLSGLHLTTAPSDSSYHFLAKLDPGGIPVQAHQNLFDYFFNSSYEGCKFTNLTWHNHKHELIFVEDFENHFSKSFISSLNRGRSYLGYCDLNYKFDEEFTFIKISSLESADTSVIFSGYTTDGFLKGVLPAIGILDTTAGQYKIIKITPSLYKPIHSYTNDLIFYATGENMLIKFDHSLKPIWTSKLDNCQETTVFEADMAPSGAIYSVRNLNKKTVVAKTLPDGSVTSCISYRPAPPVLIDTIPDHNQDYNPKGYPLTTIPDTTHAFVFTPVASVSQDFCVKMDASFEVPDTICLGAGITPMMVDTNDGIKHTWETTGFKSPDSIPQIPFPKTGLFLIHHIVQNIFCTDTADQYVRVLEHPEIPFGDTLVCGPAFLTLDLTSPGASTYYLDGQLAPPVIHLTQSGTYDIRLANPACEVEKKIKVRIVEFAPPVLPLDSTYCPGVSVGIALRPDFDQIFWDQKPVLDTFFIRDGAKHHYKATYVPDTTCTTEGDFSVSRKNCGSKQDILYAPNVFSPDGSTANDVFQVFPTFQAQVRGMKIFDRWGSLLFQFTGSNPRWDGTVGGKRSAPGVYAYWVEYLDLNDGVVKVKTGDVLLVR